MYPEAGPHGRSALLSLRSFWSFMVAASLALAGLGLFASPFVAPSGTATGTPATTALAGLGVLCAAATIWLDRALLSPGRIATRVPIPDPSLVRRHLLLGHLALWSLAELPAVLGFAQLLLDGTLGAHLALCAVSLAVLTLLMPTRRRITARMEAVLR